MSATGAPSSGIVTTGTTRVMPLRCFQCGMPVGNRQEAYERLKATMDVGGDERSIYDALGVVRPCCRVVLSRAAVDLRLHFAAPYSGPFVRIERARRADAPSVVLPTDGTTTVLPIFEP